MRFSSLGRSAVLAVSLLLAFTPGVAFADGTPDTTFSGDGIAIFDPRPDASEAPSDIAIDAEGRIVIVGYAFGDPPAPSGGFVARLSSDGQPDESFGPGGFRSLPTGFSGSTVILDSQGRIVLIGDRNLADLDFAAMRLLADGEPDSSFAGDGLATLAFGAASYDEAEDGELDSQGRLVLAGRSNAPGVSVPAIARLDAAGNPDLTLAGNGMVIPDPALRYSGISAMTIDGSGKYLLAGGANGSPPIDPALMRINPDGTFDTSFNGTGQVVFDLDDFNYDYATDLAIDSFGRPVAGLTLNEATYPASGLLRISPEGVLDSGFGTNGTFLDPGSGMTTTTDIEIDSAGRILAVGYSDPEDAATRARLTRFDTNGHPDSSFGTGGALTTDLLGENAAADAIEIDPRGRYLVAGRSYLSGKVRTGIIRYDVSYPKPPPAVDILKCRGIKATIKGDAKSNRIKGTPKRDVIAGLGGNDVIRGLAGNDVICGGPGNDTLIGGTGKDILDGGPGKDILKGGPGKDHLFGGKGRDRCLKGPGKARFSGCERRR